MPTLVLGTAQFISDYANYAGTRKDPKRLLKHAIDIGVSHIDTAPVYEGAHKAIGAIANKLKITTKIPEYKINHQSFNDHLQESLNKSLLDLKVSKLDSLLIHNTKNFLENYDADTVRLLESLKGELYNNFGFSVYEKDEANFVIDNFPVDIVQLPLNIFNTSFLEDAYLDKLKHHGILSQARSIFLQGKLLVRTKNNNSHLDQHLIKWFDYCDEYKLNPIDIILTFIHRINDLDFYIVGANTIREFDEILDFKKIVLKDDFLQRMATSNKEIIDPRYW